MTALACLRVDLSSYQGHMPPATLEHLVHKFAGAYLETRWSWPRRFAPLTDVSFLLTDPRSDDLDVAELRRLSDELQRHLFGAGEEGEVALLVFEGPHPAVTAFAAMDSQRIAAAVADPAQLPSGGRLTRIRPASAGDPQPDLATQAAADDNGWSVSPAALRRELTQTPAPPPPPAWEGLQGVYFMPREIFYGDVTMYIPQHARTHISVVDGAEHAPTDPVTFDMACMAMATRMLSERKKGALIFVPICFSSLVRPSQRDAYVEALSELPADRRSELAATVYDVPRDPAFTGLRQVRALLEPHFGAIDLRVTDPGFEIEKLASEVVSSVTLKLPDGDAHMRMAALRRFGEHLVHYKQRRIWPGVTNVRRRAEVEAAARLRIPFLTGPAICSPLPGPVGGRTVPLAHLPMSLGGWMNARDRAEQSPAA
ncbi:MAG TPA: hypothetical protein VFH92_12130 [Phenylobacterium sp.]|nr:hypothetical protein [Phenylobacterium sp.]